MTNDQLHEMQESYAHFEYQRWLNEGVFTWPWWFLLCMITIPWIVFVIFVDRKRSPIIWFFGLIVLIITIIADEFGADIGLWVYPIKLVPFSVFELPFDISLVPVAQMLIFQYLPTWKSFSIALVLQALIFAFIGEPLTEWAGLLTYYGWTHFYSFLFYILVGSLTRAFVNYWIAKTTSEKSQPA
jgi:hypothetical protein